MSLHLPAQAAVDRSELLRPATIPVEVIEDGVVKKVLEVPIGGDYGPLPADPAWVAPPGEARRRAHGS
jgi:hypothetical protein